MRELVGEKLFASISFRPILPGAKNDIVAKRVSLGIDSLRRFGGLGTGVDSNGIQVVAKSWLKVIAGRAI